MTARTDIRTAASSLTKRGQSLFSTAELIAEVRRQGSTYPDMTLRTHIVNYMCVNASGPSAGRYPDLVRVSRGLYRMAGSRAAAPTTGQSESHALRSLGRPRVPQVARARRNVDTLITNFDDYLATFEAQEVFEGPSLYFHLKAIERRNTAPSASALLQDERFLEYVYAVLPSWGMHRMGKQAAKVPDFHTFVTALQSCESQIHRLWNLDITMLDQSEVNEVGLQLWSIIAALRSSTSNSRLVSGSKTLHHVLPALMPPIDRQYTFRFFTGQTLLLKGEENPFLAWWPYFCDIAWCCTDEIRAAVGRPEVMATSPSKVIDNAIVGFGLRHRSRDE